MTPSQALGHTALREAITSASGARVGELLTRMLGGRGTKLGREIFEGALRCLLDIHAASLTSKAQVRWADDDAATELVSRTTSQLQVQLAYDLNEGGDIDAACRTLGALGGLAVTLAPRLSWHQPARADPEAPPKPPPLEMRIVGLPDRLTTTTVQRDAEKKITTTAQLERDAEPAAGG